MPTSCVFVPVVRVAGLKLVICAWVLASPQSDHVSFKVLEAAAEVAKTPATMPFIPFGVPATKNRVEFSTLG